MNLKFRKTISNFRALFSRELWSLDTSHSTKGWRKVVRFTKLVRVTLEAFAENRMGFQCVALSYFITLALIPMLAVLFAVTGGLGLSDKLPGLLFAIIPSDVSLINEILDKANNIINVAKSGTVGLISSIFFLWTIIWMLFQVERVFNNVWGIRKIPRKIYKRFSFYLLIIILIPFIVLLLFAGIFYYANMPKLLGLDLSNVRSIFEFLGWIVFYVIAVFTFSAMYKWIPSCDVKYSYALKSSLFSALIFVLFQYFYLETQIFVSRLNGVYGALAAIPLFLVWLNISWQIIIYGAELTFSYHNVDTYHITEE